MRTQEIYEYMVKLLVKDSPSNATEKKQAAEFKRDRDKTDDPRSGHLKTSTTD